MESRYTLNGVLIKRPTTFNISRYRVTKSNRMSNGNMSMEYINKKRKFNFSWAAINGSDMNTILDIIWETDACFYTLTYVENNVVKAATVYAGEIPTKLHHTGPEWVWQDVSFDLIEK